VLGEKNEDKSVNCREFSSVLPERCSRKLHRVQAVNSARVSFRSLFLQAEFERLAFATRDLTKADSEGSPLSPMTVFHARQFAR
jgi:hypothetical protein